MQKTIFPGFTLLILMLAACRQHPAPSAAHTDTLHMMQDSSLLPSPETDTPLITDTISTAVGTSYVDEAMLLGKWRRPVQGKENETEGFELKTKGKIRNLRITPYSMIYDSWSVNSDSFILKSHMQQVNEPVVQIDTFLIIGISDTSLALFPIRAAGGYEEHYTRVGHRK